MSQRTCVVCGEWFLANTRGVLCSDQCRRLRKQETAKRRDRSKGNRGSCSACGELIDTHGARGKCNRCYMRERRMSWEPRPCGVVGCKNQAKRAGAGSAGISRNFPPDQLHHALARVPPSAWSLPSTYAGTGVHHGYRRVVLVDHGYRHPEAEPFASVLDAFDPVREAWLSWIDPGGFITPHHDASPYCERWQVPIHAAGELNGQPARDGKPFQVRHWEPHWVANTTDWPRVHVVIDRDVPIPRPSAPFQTFPIPPELEVLVGPQRPAH